MREEIRVDEDGVRGDEGGVVLEEEGRGDLRDLAHDFVVFGLFLGCFGVGFELVLLAGVGGVS